MPTGNGASRRPYLMSGASLRGVLTVMPSRDLRFYGLTFGWFGIGFLRVVKK